MNKNRWLIALSLLMIASLACKALSGVRNTEAPAPNNGAGSGDVVTATAPADNSGGDIKTDFPIPTDAKNFMDMGDGSVNFQTSMSLKDVLAFYRDSFGKQGYKERTILTAISDTTISLVFDGHSSGKAIILQAVDLGNGTTNVNIRLEDV